MGIALACHVTNATPQAAKDKNRYWQQRGSFHEAARGAATAGC
jgi:hypothetical protein